MKFSIIFLMITAIGCARQHESVSEQTQFMNQFLIQTLRASDPNSLDKVIYSRADTEGTTVTRINATNLDFFIYFSMQNNAQIPASLASSSGWDIAFNRYKISSNSGNTNSAGLGGVCLSNLTSVSVAAATDRTSQNCSDDKFTIDGKSSTQGVGGSVGEFIGNALLTDWYNYEIGNLTTKGKIYIVKGGNGSNYFAVKIESYYSDAGTSGYPTFRWKKLP